MRKTTSVKALIKDINHSLARTDKRATADFKLGMCVVLESILHSTGNYKGFGFIDNSDSETGTLGYYSRFYYTSHKL
jgi:hypothetical protein